MRTRAARWSGGSTLSDLSLAGLLRVVTATDERPRTWFVDMETGEPVLELTDWVFYPSRMVSGLVAFANSDGHTLLDKELPVLALRKTSDSEPVWVGRVATDRSRIDVLGELEPLLRESCDSVWPYLVCMERIAPRGGQELTVWRVRT